MAYRSFVDTEGTYWQVWDVVLHPGEHRRPGSTLSQHRTRSIPEQRENLAHRLQLEQRVIMPAEFSGGWLAFGSAIGHRRLAPIPPAWETLSDVELDELCRAAIPTAREERR